MTADAPETVAVLDACILYPPFLRALLMRLATIWAYKPRLTEEIHGEWMRNVLADYSEVTPAPLDRTRRLMNQVAPNCLVSGYEANIPTLRLPDADDRYVLAAAIKADAAVIVTFNFSDFPARALQVYGIQAAHPELFLRAVRTHRASLRTPPKTAEDYIHTLQTNGLRGSTLRTELYMGAI